MERPMVGRSDFSSERRSVSHYLLRLFLGLGRMGRRFKTKINLMDGGRTRIRTRVFGLEGQSDIQTTLYVLVQCGGSLFKKVTID